MIYSTHRGIPSKWNYSFKYLIYVNTNSKIVEHPHLNATMAAAISRVQIRATGEARSRLKVNEGGVGGIVEDFATDGLKMALR